MKTYKILILVILSLLGLFGCEDTKDPILNPAATDGSLTFRLNNTVYTDLPYELEEVNAEKVMDVLTCVQPDYGFTAAVIYTTQVSFSDQFVDSASYISLATTVNGEKVSVIVKEIDKAIIQLYKGSVPSPLGVKDVYLRLKALPYKFTESDSAVVKPLYSNVIKMKIQPYYMELKDADPVPYFIIGLGDGAWNNSAAGLGVSIFPLSLSPDFAYDKKTGAGKFEYTGYFQASRGFKLIRDLGSWAEQWGNAGGAGIDSPVRNDGGSGNLTVPTDGYYTVTLNTVSNTLTIVSSTKTQTVYNSMGMIGDITSWSTDISMKAVEPSNSHNHVWYATYTFAANSVASDSNSGVKFRANGSWDKNWGGGSFPYSLIVSGSNIKYKAGTYVVIFNDIDGNYYFFKQ